MIISPDELQELVRLYDNALELEKDTTYPTAAKKARAEAEQALADLVARAEKLQRAPTMYALRITGIGDWLGEQHGWRVGEWVVAAAGNRSIPAAHDRHDGALPIALYSVRQPEAATLWRGRGANMCADAIRDHRQTSGLDVEIVCFAEIMAQKP